MEATTHELMRSSENGQMKKDIRLQQEEFHLQSTKPSKNHAAMITRKGKETAKSSPWHERQEKTEFQKFTKNPEPAIITPPSQTKSQGASSWASIARNTASSLNLAASKKKINGSAKDFP